MKRIIVILLLVAGSAQLKAQQTIVVPDRKLNNGLQKNYFGADLPQKLTLVKPDAAIPSNLFHLTNPNNPGTIVYSTMPVLKLSSSNVEHMPVARIGGGGYTMPVEKVTVINPFAPAQKQQP